MEFVPCERVRDSFLRALADYHAEGRYRDLDPVQLANEFPAYLRAVAAKADPDAPRPPGRVPETLLWYVNGSNYLGRISIRHRLTSQLRKIGGHIGYDVAPAERRRGHARRMLALALPFAHRLGIDPALVTCNVENMASRKVIERNGGVLAEQSVGVLRFWVPTAPASTRSRPGHGITLDDHAAKARGPR
ncbi:GNAT family N-acetyltransferase [Gandjariella thermophila]|uniref:N-acetyltransferase domain-containing protein n=1 Tax=Gandjariella thermophila TaxID=1931992 RepID=A0A4D4JF96_9PSEU|nr:GNAT family N-acetyltransferase [Gandjariella thermophila]GDY34092.1 hypothetical protein GTS_57250 [Gandjariella thermophila]